MTKQRFTRGERARSWIEKYCLIPSGPERGQHVRLTQVQCETIYKIYDNPSGPSSEPLTGPLAAYLALLHTAGPEALLDFEPEVNADVFTVWSCAGPDLREVLKRDGEVIECRELRTRFPFAAVA